jgi:hypothetical protein
MIKIMMSQPMNGLTDEQITETRNRFLEFAEKEKMIAVNTYFKDEWHSKDLLKSTGIIQLPVHFLAHSIEKMSRCNMVYFAEGWENARGCQIEHEVALQYGLDILYEEKI